MADVQDQVAVEKTVEVKSLAGLKVVQVVFNTDPEAQKAYNARYHGSSGSRTKEFSYLTSLDVQEKDFVVV